MKSKVLLFGLIACVLSFVSCKRDNGSKPNPGILQLARVSLGQSLLSLTGENKNLPVDQSILIDFNSTLDTNTVKNSVILKKSDDSIISVKISYSNSLKTISLTPRHALENTTIYTLTIAATITGSKGERFPGIIYNFSTAAGIFTIQSITLNGLGFKPPASLKNMNRKNIIIQIQFSEALDSLYYKSYFSLSGGALISSILSNNNTKLTLSNNSVLNGYTSYTFSISNNLVSKNGKTFNGFSNAFFTCLDSTLKYPVINDSALLDLVQSQTAIVI